mmetsp:Transcript_2243/g.6799  ORF Transcript_2243/g.6799 Transcript_2243/m.6799 type:complete len:242 (-) Transcript_2243:290-1015(-)
MEKCCDCLAAVRASPRALIVVKLFTLASGIFLTTAGILTIVLKLVSQPFQVVVGIYAIMFGFVVVVVEHGTWLDEVTLLKNFYALLDREFHLLSAQRGKGFFYVGVGLLTLFTESTFSYVMGASICLIVAGVLHLFRIVHEDPIGSKGTGGAPGAHTSAPQSMGSVEDRGLPDYARSYEANVQNRPPRPPVAPPAAAGGGSEWSTMVAEQNAREGAEAETYRGTYDEESGHDVALQDPARM